MPLQARMLLEPSYALLGRYRLEVKRNRRIDDVVVVDFGQARQVFARRRPNSYLRHERGLLVGKFRRITANARCKGESSRKCVLCEIGERDQFDSISNDPVVHALTGKNLDFELRR